MQDEPVETETQTQVRLTGSGCQGAPDRRVGELPDRDKGIPRPLAVGLGSGASRRQQGKNEEEDSRGAECQDTRIRNGSQASEERSSGGSFRNGASLLSVDHSLLRA
jgi:hypothetical protein